MASTKISATEVVAALQVITEKAKELFFQKPHSKPSTTLIPTTGETCAFDHDVEVSWDKIVAGLELIGMKALAASLATQRCLGRTQTSAAVNTTSNLLSSPEASGPVTSGSSPSSPSLAGLMAHRPPLPPTRWPMSELKLTDSVTLSQISCLTQATKCAPEKTETHSFLKRFVAVFWISLWPKKFLM